MVVERMFPMSYLDGQGQKKNALAGVLLTLLVFAAVVGLVYWNSTRPGPPPKQAVIEESTPTPAPSPSATASSKKDAKEASHPRPAMNLHSK
jgi:hypothetical protein